MVKMVPEAMRNFHSKFTKMSELANFCGADLKHFSCKYSEMFPNGSRYNAQENREVCDKYTISRLI